MYAEHTVYTMYDRVYTGVLSVFGLVCLVYFSTPNTMDHPGYVSVFGVLGVLSAYRTHCATMQYHLYTSVYSVFDEFDVLNTY